MARRRRRAGNVIEGLDDLMGDLEKLQGRVKGRQVVDAMRPAARILRDGIKSEWRKVHAAGGEAVRVFDWYAAKSGDRPDAILDAIFYDATDPFRVPGGPSLLVGVSHFQAPHWHFLEYGVPSHNIAATPFVRPGRDRARPAAMRQLQRDVRALIEGTKR